MTCEAGMQPGGSTNEGQRTGEERIDRLLRELRESIRRTDALIEGWHPRVSSMTGEPRSRV